LAVGNLPGKKSHRAFSGIEDLEQGKGLAVSKAEQSTRQEKSNDAAEPAIANYQLQITNCQSLKFSRLSERYHRPRIRWPNAPGS
jgi:hypothetical protein